MREWLISIRKKKGYTIREAGLASGVSKSYYEKIERGERNVPVNTAKKIAKALGFSWEKFFEE